MCRQSGEYWHRAWTTSHSQHCRLKPRFHHGQSCRSFWLRQQLLQILENHDFGIQMYRKTETVCVITSMTWIRWSWSSVWSMCQCHNCVAVVMDMIARCIKVMQWGMIDGTSPLNNNIQFYSPLKSPFLEIFMLLGKTWSAQPSLWHLLRSIIIQHQGTISRAPAKLTPSDSGCESDSSVKMNVHTFIQTKYKTYQCFQSLQ